MTMKTTRMTFRISTTGHFFQLTAWFPDWRMKASPVTVGLCVYVWHTYFMYVSTDDEVSTPAAEAEFCVVLV